MIKLVLYRDPFSRGLWLQQWEGETEYSFGEWTFEGERSVTIEHENDSFYYQGKAPCHWGIAA